MEPNRIADHLSRLALGLWVGGLVAIDFVETPARFRTTELDRNQITAMGRRVFAAWGRYEAGLGAAATAASLATSRWRGAPVGAMWGAALAQLTLIQPQMQTLGTELDFVDRDTTDPRYAQLRRLHLAYVGLDLLKLALAAPALLAKEQHWAQSHATLLQQHGERSTDNHHYLTTHDTKVAHKGTGGSAALTKGNFTRWLYRGQRPNWIARMMNRAWAAVGSSGIAANYIVTLEVTGRRSGRIVSLPVVIVVVAGQRYLVSMLGDNVQWVQNVRAAGGKAVLHSGGREEIQLEEIPTDQRAPILKAYLQRAPGARPHIPVNKGASLAEFEKIAGAFPVFRLASSAADQPR